MPALRTALSPQPAVPRCAVSRVRKAAIVFALAIFAAACSSSSDIEPEDASAVAVETEDSAVATDETTGTTEAEAEGEGEGEVDDEAATEVETETEAMGEDAESATTTTAPTPATTTTGGLSSDELNAALAASTGNRFSLPYLYLTVDQDCDGCAETMSLYYVPSVEKPSILTLEGAFIDGVAQSDFSAVDPLLSAGDPRRVAEQLDRTDADYGIDPVSGAITSWTLDGNSVTMRCLQVDTRPLDMRTEVCENSVIG